MPFRVVRVRRRIAAPIERVFAIITDHPGYARLPGVRQAHLLRPGWECRAGVGAQRELTIGPGRVLEQITAFDPPRHLGYHIIQTPFPIEHAGAEIRLREVAGGTEVCWITRFRSKTPIGKRLVERSLSVTFTLALGTALTFWKQELESHDPHWRQALPDQRAKQPLAINASTRSERRWARLRPRIPRPPNPVSVVSHTLRSIAGWPLRIATRRAGKRK